MQIHSILLAPPNRNYCIFVYILAPVYGVDYPQNLERVLGVGKAAHVSMPGVHRVASLVKRWILGTHQGSVQPDQLDFYLDEFTFRFNRRASRSRGMLFYRMMAQAVHTPPVTYNDVARKRSSA